MGMALVFPNDVLASSGNESNIGVWNRPGAIDTTRIPLMASSLAIGRVIPTIPPLEALYAACPICPSKAATEAVLIDDSTLLLIRFIFDHFFSRKPDYVKCTDQIDLHDF